MIGQQKLDSIIAEQAKSGYDFQPGFLSEANLHMIRQAARSERYDIQKAPLGRGIFHFIQSKHPEINFETEKFKSDFDAMIYFPNHDKSAVFIILNQNKPLVNQIFACAHEYYHYLSDMNESSGNLFICQLDKPESQVREHLASRFGAELLLPRDALIDFIDEFNNRNQADPVNSTDLQSLTLLTHALTLHFEMPVKAILYRLKEEGYYIEILKSVESIYNPIKEIIHLLNSRTPGRFSELFENNNLYLDDMISNLAINVYNRGLVTYDRLMEDMDRLGISVKSLGITPPIYDPGEEDDT